MNKKEQVEKAKKEKLHKEYIVARPRQDNQYKIIENVTLNHTAFVTIEDTPTKLAPGSGPVYIPLHEFNRYVRNSKSVTQGILVELDEEGNKIINDNPNIMLENEVHDLLKKPLKEFKEILQTIDSEYTLFRILYYSRDPNIDAGKAIAAQNRYNTVALPQEEPVLDVPSRFER